MKTIRYMNEEITVPDTSIFLKAVKNIVREISNASIPTGFTFNRVHYQNTQSEESLSIVWTYNNNGKRSITYYCDYTKRTKLLETRIEPNLWSCYADNSCKKSLTKYSESYTGISDVIKALQDMPLKFNGMLCDVDRVAHEYLIRRANDDTEFILEYNDFAAAFEPTLKKYGFSMETDPIHGNEVGGYYIRIYAGEDYDSSDNYLVVDTEDMIISETDGMFDVDLIHNLGDYKFNGITEMFECIKILFNAAIEYKNMQKALKKKLKPNVEFD